jgi:uncharacterized membrane protein
MDAEARERALEARVAELEERLRRLELEGARAGASAQPGLTAAHGVRAQTSWVAPTAPVPSAAPIPEPARPMHEPARPAPAPALQPAATTGEPEWLRATGAGATALAENARAAAATPREPRVSLSLADLEARLTGRALAWVGGLALVLGAIFFLSLAFTRGWIGPEARVIIGLAAGTLSLAAGAAFMDRRNTLLGHVLTPVGLAIISISLVGATRLYGLIPVELGLVLALSSSIAAAAIAVRANSPIVAAFGLIAVLVAPPLLGAPPDLATLAFVAVVLIGTTAVALWRSWAWLPMNAFLLAAPQVAVWITGHPDSSLGIIGLVGFWVINIVAAAGEEARRHRDDLSASSATLMLANVAFLVWAGFALLDGDLSTYRGAFLALVALAHLSVGTAFVRRDGETDLFGLLTIGTGIAALSMAAPVHFGADVIPLAWTAEAVALTWVAARRGHPYSAVVASALYLLAGAYLVQSFASLGVPGTAPLTSGQVGSLAFFIGGAAVGLWFLRDRSLRSLAAAYASVITLSCAALSLDGVLLAIGLTAVMVGTAALPSILELLPSRPITWQTTGLIPADLRARAWRPAAQRAIPAALVIAVAFATTAIVARVYGPSSPIALDGIPFIDVAGGALAVYLAGLAFVAWLQGDEPSREPIAALGLVVVGWAVARAMDDVAVVVAWSALLVAGFALWRGLRTLATVPGLVMGRSFGIALTSDRVLPAAAVFVGGLAALHLLAFELPILEVGDIALPAVPFTDAGTIGAMSLAVATLVAGAIVGGRAAWRAPVIIAGVILAYLVPFEVASWAVVVLWAGLGVVATAISRREEAGASAFLAAALVITGAATTLALEAVAPSSRLNVGSIPVDGATALQTLVALGALTGGWVAIAWAARPRPWARWIGAVAGTSFVYLASIALVDVAAIQVGGSVPLEDLRTWGRVGLSVLWAVLGLVAFVGGLRWRIADFRHAGLALLGLATVKVFLVDLSGLDVAYRVVSLIALGLLLLAGAWLWQRDQPRPDAAGSAGTASLPGDPPA